MNKGITLSILSALLLSTGAIADEVKVSDVEAEYSAKSKVEASDELKQSINFGFANTTGNTETLSLNGKYDMSFTTVVMRIKHLKLLLMRVHL